MHYFIDFDRTIFDTPSFKKALRRRDTFLLHLGLLKMSPDDVKKFLYSDVEGFLASHDCTIVTYGVKSFITAKVISALAHFPHVDVIYTTHRKGPVIKKICESRKGAYTFIDDMHFQLESVSKECPDIKVYEMRRDSMKGDGRWPVIHSLNELSTH